MLEITCRKELIAYRLAEWMVSRQCPAIRLVTVRLWADINHYAISDDEAEYALQHWHDYVVTDN